MVCDEGFACIAQTLRLRIRELRCPPPLFRASLLWGHSPLLSSPLIFLSNFTLQPADYELQQLQTKRLDTTASAYSFRFKALQQLSTAVRYTNVDHSHIPRPLLSITFQLRRMWTHNSVDFMIIPSCEPWRWEAVESEKSCEGGLWQQTWWCICIWVLRQASIIDKHRPLCNCANYLLWSWLLCCCFGHQANVAYQPRHITCTFTDKSELSAPASLAN